MTWMVGPVMTSFMAMFLARFNLVTGPATLATTSCSGASGEDLLVGDCAALDAGPSGDGLYIELGDDALDGGRDDDILIGDVATLAADGETVVACGDDSIAGGAGNDVLMGDAESASVGGELSRIVAGNDILDGGAGDDLIVGDFQSQLSPLNSRSHSRAETTS